MILFLRCPQDLGTGTTFKQVSSKTLKSFRVPVPPLPEQHRIVDQIDALQARSAAARAALDAIPPLLERFRQSVLAAAFRGDLTRGWRAQHPDAEPASALLERIRAERRRRWIEDYAETARGRAENRAAKKGQPWTADDDARALAAGRKKGAARYEPAPSPDLANGTVAIPSGWSVVSVAELTECLDRHRRPITRADRRAGPYPYYGANGQVDSVDGYLFDEDLVLVTEDETFYGRTKPIAYRVSGRCWVNNHAHVLRAIPPVDTGYLCFALMHYDVRPWLSGTTGRAKLTQGALNVLPIALPPAREMAVIADIVGRLMDQADALSAIRAPAGAQLDRLDQSILAKAFRGELVPQDPADEPAAALLERIRAERAAAGPKKTRRR